MPVILITGAGGLIGRSLEKALKAKSYTVRKLVRDPEKANGVDTFYWNYKEGVLQSGALTDVEYIINLSGANVSRWPWSKSYKKEIYDSRIESTRFLRENVSAQNIPLKKFISASGIGIYGDTGIKPVDESDPFGNDFLARVCVDWEKEANAFSEKQIPVCIFRIGVVLTSKGGFLPKVSLPVNYFAGTVPGSGKQIISWIGLQDLIQMMVFALDHSTVTGTFNACSSQPVTMQTMMQTIANTRHRPLWLPNVPGWLLKGVLGEMSTVVLSGCAARNQKIKDTGFQFRFDTLTDALAAEKLSGIL